MTTPDELRAKAEAAKVSDQFWFAIAWLGMRLPAHWRLSRWLTKCAANGLIRSLMSTDDDNERAVTADCLLRFIAGEDEAIDELVTRSEKW